ncbi:envelope stress response membrane protein PspC [Pseudidiomarina sp.]|uniref:envelope stress response membrane protein PspC n=1 Tax=Pseudidiomarina sp. TaxID=2081707 RepID=UPI003A96D7ED
MSNDCKERKTLTRDKANGKIAGVCAGIANYFNIEVWLVRIIAVTALIFSSSFVLVIYIAMWFILDEKKPQPVSHTHHNIGVKTKVWQAGEPPQRAFQEITQEFNELERSLQKMERYVTSNAYQIDRELDRL